MIERIKRYDFYNCEFTLYKYTTVENNIWYCVCIYSNKFKRQPLYQFVTADKEKALWYILDKVNLLDDIRINKRIKPL